MGDGEEPKVQKTFMKSAPTLQSKHRPSNEGQGKLGLQVKSFSSISTKNGIRAADAMQALHRHISPDVHPTSSYGGLYSQSTNREQPNETDSKSE